METCKVDLTFEPVDEILWCDHLNEISLAILSHGTNCFTEFEKNEIWDFLEFLLWPLLGVEGLICRTSDLKISGL